EDSDDLLRRFRCHLFDIHAALGRGNAGRAAAAPVDEHGEIDLAGDLGALFDIDALDLFALGPRLMGNQLHAEHGIGPRDDLLDRTADLDPARLAAAAGMDLGLHHPNGTVELLGDG